MVIPVQNLRRPLSYARFRFTLYLKHAVSFRDSGSSCILDPPPLLAIPVQHISSTRRLIWRFRAIIYLKHAPYIR